MSLLAKKKRNGGLPSLRSNLDELFDMDRFFDESNWQMPTLTKKMQQVPATNIKELDHEYLLELAAPGLKKDDFGIDVKDNMLEIEVEREEDKNEEEENFTRREYNYTAFYRSFSLPENVIADQIKAEYRDGLLKVHLPKSKEDKAKNAKRISVS